MKKSDAPVVVEQILNAKIEIVWRAITQVNLMRQWFFENIPDFKAEVGFETQFNVATAERNFLHLWKISEVIPIKLIRYNWKYADYPGDSFVQFELFKLSRGTKLVVSMDIVEDFPDNIPEFRRESCVAGWQYFIQQRLKSFFEV